MFCPHCGMENPDDSRFCAGCGKDVTVVEAVDETVLVAEETPVSEIPVQEVSEPEAVVVDEPVAEEPVAEVVEEPAAEVVEEPVAEVVPEPVVEPVQPQYVPPQPQYVPPQPQYQQPQYQQPQYQQPVYQQPVYQQPVYQQPVYQQPVYQQPRYAQPSYAKPAPVGDSRVTAAVKRACGSPLMLIIAICYTLSLLTSFLSAFGGSAFGFFLPAGVNGATLIFNLIRLVLSILMCVSLYVIYAAAASKKNTMSTAGLSMLKVVYILRLIFLCIVMAIVVFAVGIAMLDALDSYYADDEERILMILAFFGTSGITALIICYHAAILKSISKVQTALRTGYADHRVSGFVAVICFLRLALYLLAVVLIFIVVSATPTYGLYRINEEALLIIAIYAVVKIALLFMYGVQIFRYRGILKEFSNN